MLCATLSLEHGRLLVSREHMHLHRVSLHVKGVRLVLELRRCVMVLFCMFEVFSTPSCPPRGDYRKPRAVIGRTMFETDRLTAEHVSRCNKMDEVWVPTNFHMKTFLDSGVHVEKLRKVRTALTWLSESMRDIVNNTVHICTCANRRLYREWTQASSRQPVQI